jgi:predicted nuclease of restriction endonuclease-like (RecB) superfamily
MKQMNIRKSTDIITDIKQIIEQARSKAYTSINTLMIQSNWLVGRRIVEEEQGGESRAEYGKALLRNLAEELMPIYGNSYSARRLQDYRQFYLYFKDIEIWHSRVPNLTWTHYRELLTVGDEKARYWYMQEANKEMWSVRTLHRNISSQYYYRLLQSQVKDVVIDEMKQITASMQGDKLEFIKNPVVAEFLGLAQNVKFSETELESTIISHLQKFIMELGKGYAFVARQQHIRTDMGDFYIDLVFYNYILKCFMLVDLKTEQITHQDVGQMDMYIRMYDELKRTENDNPTIGLILCSRTSEDMARYSMLKDNDRLFQAKYLTFLPTKEELSNEIERQKMIFRLQHGNNILDE